MEPPAGAAERWMLDDPDDDSTHLDYFRLSNSHATSTGLARGLASRFDKTRHYLAHLHLACAKIWLDDLLPVR